MASHSFTTVLLFCLPLLLAVPYARGADATGATSLPAKAVAAAQRAPASLPAANASGGTKDIGEELKVTGQSRSLSMDLLFRKDKDKFSFGNARTDYKDKVSAKTTNL